MRLFKYAAVVALAAAGNKFETNEVERECISNCKDDIGCHGQDNTDGPTECIQECRDLCVVQRKDAIKEHLSRTTQKKATIRKAEATLRREEQREQTKMVNPPPMIKDFHQLYEEGDVPRRFIACLKHERETLNCEGHGEEMWPCKRMMVSSCLDRSEDFENLGSGQLVALVQQFREGLDDMNKLKYNDPTTPPTIDPNLIMGVKPNNKGKTKVNHIKRKLEKEKHGKINYLPNFVPVATTKPTPQTATTKIDRPVYEDEPEYEMERDWTFTGQEMILEPIPKKETAENSEGEPIKGDGPEAKAEDKGEAIEGDGREAEGEPIDAEFENPKAWEKAKANKQALYSYVGNGGSKKVTGGKNSKATMLQDEIQIQIVHAKKITKDDFINEMCRCRTSMEHYRVKNYLARNKDGHGVSGLGDWKHHDELCKWCAFPNSKKCWQCQKHWEKAADSPASDDTETRRRNEQNQMACFLYVRSVKIGKFNPMNSKNNDPCPMRNLHHGEFNPWQAEGKFLEQFTKYKELHHLHHQSKDAKKSNKTE